MDYKLAKKLKEAGFPIKTKQGCSNCLGDLHEGCDRNCVAELPIGLSELIEACGSEFEMLSRVASDNLVLYHVYGLPKTYKEPIHSCVGFTPQEAVANLWLKLNQT